MIKFTLKAKGFHVATLPNGVKVVLSNAGGRWGWHLTLRTADGRIVSRLGSEIATLADAKSLADRIVANPHFGALLLRAAAA